MIHPNFWRGKKVFLTGHTGFKGTWLALLMTDLGAQVTGFSLNPITQPSLFAATGLEGLMTRSIVGDIRDQKLLTDELVKASPEIVFHLAAQPLVLKSYADPVDTLMTNMMGTAHILNACRKVAGLKAILNVTTDKVYKNESWPWPYRETDRLGGSDPYSASKACSELISDSFRASFFQRDFSDSHFLATARAGNVIGGGDWSEDRLVPDMMRSIFSEKVVILRNPSHVRPWQHVLDSLIGYMMLTEKLYQGQATESWNFAPELESSVDVEKLTKLFLKAMGQGKYQVEKQTQSARESSTLKLDNSKARKNLGWAPACSIEKAVSLTAQWYKDFYAGEPALNLCRQQIAAFINHEN